MREHLPRLFDSDAVIHRVGHGLLDRSLPRADWTHEAHLAACLWLVRERPDVALESALPDIIRSYNVAVGGINDDTQGYHETLTQLYVRGVRAFDATDGAGRGLCDATNALLMSAMGAREWPLRYYTRERLFSVEARRAWLEPDLSPLTF